jgi:hypothetical protein
MERFQSELFLDADPLGVRESSLSQQRRQVIYLDGMSFFMLSRRLSIS